MLREDNSNSHVHTYVVVKLLDIWILFKLIYEPKLAIQIFPSISLQSKLQIFMHSHFLSPWTHYVHFNGNKVICSQSVSQCRYLGTCLTYYSLIRRK